MTNDEFRLPYYNKDYDIIFSSVKSNILSTPNNKWTNFADADPGVILLKNYSAIGDMLAFTIDNLARETVLETARRRENVARNARLIGYEMRPKQAGLVEVSVVLDEVQTEIAYIPQYTQFSTIGQNVLKYNSLEAFAIPANQSCVFSYNNNPENDGYILDSQSTDISLQGINIINNTDKGKIYILQDYDGSFNKIALFTQKPVNATLDNSIDTLERTTTQPTFITGVVCSSPTGIDGAGNLVFQYNGGTGMTLAYRDGISQVVDAGGAFVLVGQNVIDTLTVTVTTGSLPTSFQSDTITIGTIFYPENAFKVAYGDDSSTSLQVDLTEINSSGIQGYINISANFTQDTPYDDGEIWIKGPISFEGTLQQDIFTSTGEINQAFKTTYSLQQIASSLNKTIDLFVDLVQWEETEDFFFLAENKFKVRTIDRSFSEIIFGDGSSGNIPNIGSTIKVRYIVGNGSLGYVGSNTLNVVDSTVFLGTIPIGVSCTNILESTDSADEESIEITKEAAKHFFKSRGRAVTAEDYEILIPLYTEAGKLNPKKVQAYKDETEADLVNELLLYVLSTDPFTGRVILVNIDLSSSGDLYDYIDQIKVGPEGILKEDGNSGVNNGTIVDVGLWWVLYIQEGYIAEDVKNEVATVIKNYFQALKFQETVVISSLVSNIMGTAGVRAVNIFTDPNTQDSSTAAFDLDLSGPSNKGKIYALPEQFYVNYNKYIRANDETYDS